MNRKYLLGILFYFLSISAHADDEVFPSEQPMYGNFKRSEIEMAVDRELVQKAIALAGSEEKALKQTIDLAWKYYKAGDFKSAIKRFNQAWLIDSSNAEVYFGFGMLLSERGDLQQAVTMYHKTLEINPSHHLAVVNLGRAYTLWASQIADFDKNKADSFFEKAEPLFRKGIELDTICENCGYTYFHWAEWLIIDEQYGEAAEKIKLSESHGWSVPEEFKRMVSEKLKSAFELKNRPNNK